MAQANAGLGQANAGLGQANAGQANAGLGQAATNSGSNLSINSNTFANNDTHLYGQDTFTYMVKAHGCYRPDEKVLLGDNLYLSLHAFQDEGLEYNPLYAREFCQGRLTTHPGYKPIDTVQEEYFQMLFCRNENDKHPCYIHCCTTNERVYDFVDGDLLLSEVIYLVNFHAQSHDAYWIDLNLLTCNAPCTNDPLKRTRVLVEKHRYQGPRMTKGHRKHPNTRKCTVLHRPATLEKVRFSNGDKTYYPMVGDRVLDKTGQYVVLTQKTKAKARDWTFLGSIMEGSFVKYYDGEDQLFVVEAVDVTRDDCLWIRNTRDPSVALYVRPNAVTHYRVVDMNGEDMDGWIEYY